MFSLVQPPSCLRTRFKFKWSSFFLVRRLKQYIAFLTTGCSTGRWHRLPFDSTRKVSSFLRPAQNPSFSYSSIQCCPFGLCGQTMFSSSSWYILWWTCVFVLCSVFNIMLKVSWETDLQNTLFLFMCCMWKNHLQRGRGVKANTGLNPGHFFFFLFHLVGCFYST